MLEKGSNKKDVGDEYDKEAGNVEGVDGVLSVGFNHLLRRVFSVRVWSSEQDVVHDSRERHEPGVELPCPSREWIIVKHRRSRGQYNS